VHDTLGVTHGSRIGTMVANVIENSIDKPYVTMTEPILGITNRLKDFMFANVYTKRNVAKEELSKGSAMLKQLFRLYMDHPEQLPAGMANPHATTEEHAQLVLDYVAGMTDRYAGDLFIKHFFPRGWRSL
jgi:dGTPase